jgi:hypothetical protein
MPRRTRSRSTLGAGGGLAALVIGWLVLAGCTPTPPGPPTTTTSTTTTTTPPPAPAVERVDVVGESDEIPAGLLDTDAYPLQYDVTADGHTVLFNSGTSVLRRDLVARTTTNVGLDKDGNMPPTGAHFEGMSDDGRYLLISSLSPLAGEADDSTPDLYRRDLQTGSVVKVSPAGIGGTLSTQHRISNDGRFVLYGSQSGNGNTFVIRDLQNSIDIPLPGTNQRTAAISGDGRYVALLTFDALDPLDVNNVPDFYLWDRTTNAIVRMSKGTPVNNPALTIDGTATPGLHGAIRMTTDGRFVQFGAGSIPLMRFDRQTGTLFDLGFGVGASGVSAIGTGDQSEDGRYATLTVGVFGDDSGHPLGSPNNLVENTVRYDTTTGALLTVSVAPGSTPANGDSRWARASADGSTVVFSSAATNLVPSDTNGVPDLFAMRNIPTSP